MADEVENPNPQPVRGRPRRLERRIKVVSFIPERFIEGLNRMAEEDGRSRASMVDRIIQAAVKQFWENQIKHEEAMQLAARVVQTMQEKKNSASSGEQPPATQQQKEEIKSDSQKPEANKEP